MKGWDTLGDKSLQQDIYDFKESLFQVCSCVLINVGTNWTQPRHYISTAKWLHIKFLQHVMGTDCINIVSRMMWGIFVKETSGLWLNFLIVINCMNLTWFEFVLLISVTKLWFRDRTFRENPPFYMRRTVTAICSHSTLQPLVVKAIHIERLVSETCCLLPSMSLPLLSTLNY